MPELIDRQAALRLCIEGDGYDDEGFTEGYNFAVSEIREELQKLPTIEQEGRIIPKEVSATDVDKLTEMIKDCLLQAYPNGAMFTAVRHGRWENIPGMNNTVFCSECLAAANKEIAMKYKGCPFCLARMDGGADNG